MIHINFEEPNTSDWKLWRQRCEEEQARYKEAMESGNPISIRESLYKEQKFEVYLNPQGSFYGKCAYCEQKIFGDQNGDVEHYRPKSRVTDESGNPVTIEVEGETKELPGYYWLVYDWKNLLPSCILCNRPSTKHSRGRLIGKADRFPVRNFRATSPTEEKHEEPLLIHPVLDDPEDHLESNEMGILHPRTDVGTMSIGIFGLNDRDLPNERAKKYHDVRLKMALLAERLSDDPNSLKAKNLLNELLAIKKGRDEFTVAALRAIADSKDNLKALDSL